MGKNIDKRDIAILWELFNNSRQPITKIAQKVKMPKETVKYRVEQLMESGVLNKTYAIVNSAKFGLTFYEVYVKLQGLLPEEEAKCIQALKDHPLVCWLITTTGQYSIAAVFLAKKPEQFYECYNYVRTLFGRHAKELSVLFDAEGQQFEYPYFKNFPHTSIKTATHAHEPQKLDKTDIGILKILTENARTPLKDISRKVKSTEATVRSRIKWLEKNDYILQYTSLLHPGRSGYFFYLLLIRLETPNTEIENYIKTIPEIFYLIKTVGPYDLKVEFYVKSDQRIHEIEDELHQKFGDKIQRTEKMHVKKEHVVRYFVDA